MKIHEPFVHSRMYDTASSCYDVHVHPFLMKQEAMVRTKLFKNGNSQAVRIPAELAYSQWDMELVIERHGDELRIRPARQRMGDVLGTLARFSPGFMREGRGHSTEDERDAL